MKDIIVLLDLFDETMPAMHYAIKVANRFEAHLTGLALSIELMSLPILAAPMPVPVDLMPLQTENTKFHKKVESMVQYFETHAKSANLSFDTYYSNGVGGINYDDYVRHCRLTDLIIIGQNNPNNNEPQRGQLIETALFESARPLLLVPYTGVPAFNLEKMMIAWDGSLAAARAVHASFPFLHCAKEIDIITVDDGRNISDDVGINLAAYLARHQLKARVQKSPLTESVAHTLLNYSTENNIHLTIMGGYGHNRMREMILGGVTRNMLESMTFPVLMAH